MASSSYRPREKSAAASERFAGNSALASRAVRSDRCCTSSSPSIAFSAADAIRPAHPCDRGRGARFLVAVASDDWTMSLLLRVAELNAAYAATIDTDRLESWPDFFVEDCLYKITSAENHKRGHSAGVVYADSRAMLQDRVTALRTANIYERQSYRHIVGLPVIGANPADGIAAETPFLVARIMRDGRTDLFVTGVYLDRIRDEADSLRFAERLVVCDSGHFDTLLAIPL
jgi:3-phenylpropionate/cinnamic acid dioxygenase small subunit